MLLELIINYITNIIESTGYLGVFIFMVMESMIFPVPSEAVMPFAGILASQGTFDFLTIIIISGIASVTGSLLSYYMGLYGGYPFLEKYGKYFLLSKRDLKWSHDFFEKYGDRTIFISRFIPIVRHVISIPAGVARMNLKSFIISTAMGATAWNFILAYAGYKSPIVLNYLSKYSKILDVFVIITLTIIILWYIKRHLRNR